MSVPVISVARMREWEKATWDAGISENDVIAQVGRKLGAWLIGVTSVRDGRLLIVAGKGNNGEDARLTIPFFEKFCSEVPRIVNVRDPAADFAELDRVLSERSDWAVVDALFGIGLNRPLNLDWIRVVERLNDSGAEIFSVDCPSGLDADTGEPMGLAVRADRTLTLGAPKRGLLMAGAREFVGRLELEPDIGLVSLPLEGGLNWTTASDFAGFPPRRAVDDHKGNLGHLVLVAGSVGYHGAAVLAAEAALRAMPGLVSVFTDRDCYIPVASQLKAAMVHPWNDKVELPEKCTAVLIGPGLAAPGVEAGGRELARRLWAESPRAVVADASSLDWLPAGPTPEGALRVITPHPGEAARMLGVSAAEVQADRIGALRGLSARYGGCWVVLKGHHTLVGAAEGPVCLNPSGNALLAQGGSGDVLAGFLGGLIAQPRLAADPALCLRYGAWVHGDAADMAESTGAGLSIDSLPRRLGARFDDDDFWEEGGG